MSDSARRILLVTTTAIAEGAGRTELRDAVGDAQEVWVVAPAAKISRLDWLTNAEDEARAEAARAAESTAATLSGDTRVLVDRTSEDTEPAASIQDALRNFSADEILVVTHAGDETAWLEDETVRAAIESSALPVRRIELA
jgi:hypothetical protein